MKMKLNRTKQRKRNKEDLLKEYLFCNMVVPYGLGKSVIRESIKFEKWWQKLKNEIKQDGKQRRVHIYDRRV